MMYAVHIYVNVHLAIILNPILRIGSAHGRIVTIYGLLCPLMEVHQIPIMHCICDLTLNPAALCDVAR